MSENQKVTHSRDPQSLKSKSKPFPPRSDEKYTRIEKYDEINLLNSLMFEFHLRLNDFRKLYDEYDQKFSKAPTDHFGINSLCHLYIEAIEVEELKLSFEQFGYKSDEVLKFIFNQYNKSGRQYDAWEKIDILVQQLSCETDKVLLNEGVDPTVAIVNDCIKLQEKKLSTSIEFNYYHPQYRPDVFSTFEMCVDFNALESKENAIERIQILLDGFYERFSHIDNVYIYNQNLKKTKVTKEKQPTTDTREQVGSRNAEIAKAFANYFYVYDQIQNDITQENIQDALTIYCYPNPNYFEGSDEDITTKTYSLTTVKKNMKKMKFLIDNQGFKEFFYQSSRLFEEIEIDD